MIKNYNEFINESSVNVNELEAKYKEWQEMTDDNCHSERLFDIAKFFGLKDFEKKFKEYVDKSSLTVQDTHDRYGISQEMYDEIQRKFSRKIRNEVEATA